MSVLILPGSVETQGEVVTRVHSCFHWYKMYKNRLRAAGVIIKKQSGTLDGRLCRCRTTPHMSRACERSMSGKWSGAGLKIG